MDKSRAPVLNRPIAQHGLNLGGAASRPDVVIDPRQADEDPLAPVASFNSRTGLIAFDDSVGYELLFDLLSDGHRVVIIQNQMACWLRIVSRFYGPSVMAENLRVITFQFLMILRLPPSNLN